jgi:hypothetical protein
MCSMKNSWRGGLICLGVILVPGCDSEGPRPGDVHHAQPPPLEFRPHVIDSTLSQNSYGQTAFADLDGDGRPEYVMGRRAGELYAYKYRSADSWARFVVGHDSPSDVGLAALDVDGDGRTDLVTGGAWYRNSGRLDQPFERIMFDADLQAVHDIVVADVDGDGRLDVLTMSDRNNLRWYRIPDDPTAPWLRFDIGEAVHAGLSVGDVNGNGRLDVVRTDVWFENVDGDGRTWREHYIGPNTPPPPDFQPAFAFNATKSVVIDVNGSGSNDIIFTDNEIPGGKVWWMENVDGTGLTWRRHEIPFGDTDRRGAFHSLQVADFTGNGHPDVLTSEMDAIRGARTPRWFIWENVDGTGTAWRERVILDINLGGHETVAADVTGNGRLDLMSKPWRAHEDNSLGGRAYVIFLENVSDRPALPRSAMSPAR